MRTRTAHPGEAPAVAKGKYLLPGGRTSDQTAIARDWEDRGFSCQVWVDPPGQEWNDFIHDTAELVAVLEGRLEFSVVSDRGATRGSAGRQTWVLEPGDELFIPRAAKHSVKNIHPRTSRWLFGYGV